MSRLATMTGIIALALGLGLSAASAGSIVIEQSGKAETVENSTKGAFDMLKGLFDDMDQMDSAEPAYGSALMDEMKRYLPENATDEERRAVLDMLRKMRPELFETADVYAMPGDDTSTAFKKVTPNTTVVKRRDSNGNTATIIQSE